MLLSHLLHRLQFIVSAGITCTTFGFLALGSTNIYQTVFDSGKTKFNFICISVIPCRVSSNVGFWFWMLYLIKFRFCIRGQNPSEGSQNKSFIGCEMTMNRKGKNLSPRKQNCLFVSDFAPIICLFLA